LFFRKTRLYPCAYNSYCHTYYSHDRPYLYQRISKTTDSPYRALTVKRIDGANILTAEPIS
jgi:hypothetical protein